jgi:tetratricopeptide (TPR) repeat protein
VAYFKKQDLQRAKEEFLKDAAVEPDVAYNYDQLGLVNSLLGNHPEAEKNPGIAARSRPGQFTLPIGRVYQSEGKYSQARAEVDAAAKIDPVKSSVHYLRGSCCSVWAASRKPALRWRQPPA